VAANEILSFYEEEDEEEGRAWLVTYADMVTLLLTFFVMLVAISSMDRKRFDHVMTSIHTTLGSSPAMGGRLGRIEVFDTRRRVGALVTGAAEEPLLKDIRQRIKLKNLDEAVEVATQDNKVILRVKGQVLFPTASADLSPGAGNVLDQIARIIGDYPEYRLDVGGHTDSRPIRTSKFDSNWELSALRATAVLRYLVGRGVNPRQLTATGYADTDPLAPNTSPENMARNRRVEFVLEKRER
jgi:chemotaxis protein MotB